MTSVGKLLTAENYTETRRQRAIACEANFSEVTFYVQFQLYTVLLSRWIKVQARSRYTIVIFLNHSAA